MNLNEYQKLALRTAGEYSTKLEQLENAALGLAGESGEFCDLLKKFMFQGASFDREHFLKELGDILWYASLASNALDESLETTARMNIDKLKKRYPDGFDPIRANNRSEDDI